MFSLQTRAHVTNSNPISAHRSAKTLQCTATNIKELFFPVWLSVFIYFLENGCLCAAFLCCNTDHFEAVIALTGSHTHPQSCLRDVEGAFLHSHSTTCLMDSFWWEYSRAMPLCQGGNVSVNSGKRKDKTEDFVILQ